MDNFYNFFPEKKIEFILSNKRYIFCYFNKYSHNFNFILSNTYIDLQWEYNGFDFFIAFRKSGKIFEYCYSQNLFYFIKERSANK